MSHSKAPDTGTFLSVTPEVQREVISRLQDGGVAPRAGHLRLDLLPRNPDRRDFLERLQFCLLCDGKPVCLLAVGTDLEDIARRTEAFAAACPAISCRGLALLRAGELDWFVTEYFEGQTLEAWAKETGASAEQIVACVAPVLEALQRTMIDSDQTALELELETMFGRILGALTFTAVDQIFLKQIAFPFVRMGARSDRPRVRWTNGDFVARNILVARNGEVRLIDYEFAALTHFHRDDFWRWSVFSDVVAEAKMLTVFADAPSAGHWSEALFILRQILLANETNGAPLAAAVGGDLVDRLHLIFFERYPSLRTSLFFPRLAGSAVVRRLEAAELEIVKRGEWGMSLAADVEKLRGDNEALKIAEQERVLLARAREVEIEKQQRAMLARHQNETAALRAQLERASAEQERLVAAHGLEAEGMRSRLETAEACRDQLVRGHEKERGEIRARLQLVEVELAHRRERLEILELAEANLRADLVRGQETNVKLAQQVAALGLDHARLKQARDEAAELHEKARAGWEAALKSEISMREQQLAEAEDQFAAALKENQQLLSRLNSVESEVTWNRAQLERWQQSDQTLRQMQTSWSWRVTAPLRKIHQMLGDPLYRRRR